MRFLFRSAAVLGRSNTQTPRRFRLIASPSGLADLLRITDPRSNGLDRELSQLAALRHPFNIWQKF